MCFSSSYDIILSYLVKNSMDRVSKKKKKNMKRLRGRRREETREINQKHWRANHHYLYLENHVFSTWRRSLGTFVNDSNCVTHVAARFGAPDEDVNSDQYQIFHIFRAVFNIQTGKKCSDYILISFVE